MARLLFAAPRCSSRVTRKHWCGVMALACLVLCAPAEGETRLVALEGDTSPDLGLPFVGFESPPIVNDSGQVMFAASVDDGTLDFTSALWSEGDGVGALRAVAVAGEAAPFAPGRTYSGFQRWLFNDLGDAAFQLELDNGLEAIYTDRDRLFTDPVTLIAKLGDPAVDTGPGRTYNASSGFVLSGMGDIHSGTAFYAALAPGDPPFNFPAVAVYNEGFNVVLRNEAELGDLAPGTVRPSVGGGLANFSNVSPPVLSDAGDVAFAATTNAGLGGAAIGGFGVWTTSPGGALRPVALSDMAAPGSGGVFFVPSQPVINPAGQIGFKASTSNSLGVGPSGVWVERNGQLDLVALETQPAPGTTSTFASITSDPLIDNDGDAAFIAETADGRDGLWLERDGVLGLVALQGQAATDTGLTFLNLLDLAENDLGQVAFRAQLSDLSSDGIFATDRGGALRKIAATGDVLDLGGLFLQVEQLDFRGISGSVAAPANGVDSGLSDLGHVAYIAYGEVLDGDLIGTGEFLATIVVSDLATGFNYAPGDYNGDGVVDVADYTVWRDSLGSGFGVFAADGDGDGFVTIDDYAVWRNHFGEGAPGAAAAAPEPGAAALILAAAALVRRRR